MKRLILVIFFLSAVLTVQNAFAHDLIIPEWRGISGTTYQEWSFSTSSDPVCPDVISNPFGTASADITVGQYGSGWHNQLLGMGSQTGYWDLGGTGGSITIGIDNVPEPNPYKEIWIQITYYDDITAPPEVVVPSATLISRQSGLLIEHVSTGGDWKLDQYVFRIEPNPNHETIQILPHPHWMSVIDHVIIDTFCVPEPASLFVSLFGIVGLLFAHIRR